MSYGIQPWEMHLPTVQLQSNRELVLERRLEFSGADACQSGADKRRHGNIHALDLHLITCNTYLMKSVPAQDKAASELAKKAARERVRKHRQSLRDKGLRPIQIWVPDTRKPGFVEEARRQCLALKNDPQEKEIMDWIEQVADYSGWV